VETKTGNLSFHLRFFASIPANHFPVLPQKFPEQPAGGQDLRVARQSVSAIRDSCEKICGGSCFPAVLGKLTGRLGREGERK